MRLTLTLILILSLLALSAYSVRLRKRMPNSALLREIVRSYGPERAPVSSGADDALARAKIEVAITSGKLHDNLNEVQPPKEGISDAVKQAYLEDQKEKRPKY